MPHQPPPASQKSRPRNGSKSTATASETTRVKKKDCNRAVQRCAGGVRPSKDNDDKDVELFLECVDMAEACSATIYLPQDNQCFANAKNCKKEQNLPLGELTKLTECAMVGVKKYRVQKTSVKL